jgi:hypothetical protein
MRNRKKYPANWQEIATACKARAGWRCEHCTIAHGDWRTSRRTGRPYRVWLQAAHKNHLERLREDAGLLCLCFACHARYDYRHDQRLREVRLECLKHRRLLQQAGYR